MDRITEKNLRAAVDALAFMLDIPTGPVWIADASGKRRARVGALLLNVGSATNRISWGVGQIMNESGGERTLIRAHSARDLWEAISNWREGYAFAKQEGVAVQS